MSGPGEIRDWLSVAAMLLSIGAVVYTWLTRDAREAGAAVAKLDSKVNEAIKERDRKIDLAEDRISRIEGELKGVPDRDSVHKMQLEMVAMRGSVDVLNERLIPLAAISGRLQEFLLEQAKGS
jgi:hypothetical protein